MLITPATFVHKSYHKLQEDYKILKGVIGTGTFGEVRRCINLESKEVRAVKIIKKYDMNEENVSVFQ